MFGIFGRKPTGVNVIDKVWMSADAKEKACRLMFAANAQCVFVAWFTETQKRLREVLQREDAVMMYNTVDREKLHDKLIIMAEHHPLLRKETEFFKQLNLNEVPVLSSLDEPLFMYFGGERTIALMKKLGMAEDEVLGHRMITASIKNAQQKIEKQVVAEREARSQHEWFELNLPLR